MNCHDILERHAEYLRGEFRCTSLDGGRLSVVTPYQLPDGDLIELFVEPRPAERIRVRDLGETIAMLVVQGFDPSVSDKRRWLLDQALRLSGVEFAEGELRKEGPASSVGALLLDVATASRAIADLIYLNRSQEPQDFDSRVIAFLADHAPEVESRVAIKGVSGHVYRLTARVHRVEGTPLLVSTLAPRSQGRIKGIVDRTVRQWVDLNHDLGRTQKLSFVNDAGVRWPESDLRLLNRLSMVTGWRGRHQVAAVLEGRLEEPDFERAMPLWDAQTPEG